MWRMVTWLRPPEQSRTPLRLEGRAGYWSLTLHGLLHPVRGGDGSPNAR